MFCKAFIEWTDSSLLASVDTMFHNYRYDGCFELIDAYYWMRENL